MNYQKKINVGKDFHHDSASLQVSGEAIYIDDMIKNSELMHASLVTSDIACGTILKIDISKLKELPFKTYFITANDIPGKNDVGPIFSGEPILAEKEISYYGQPIGVVVADSFQKAKYASKLVKVKTKKNNKPILNVNDAFKKKSFLAKPQVIENGDADKSIKNSSNKLKGVFTIGGQDHFYLETHVAISSIGENDELTVWSSTQHPTEVQHGVSKVLNIPYAKVESKTRRLGGGFGLFQVTIFKILYLNKSKNNF